MLKKISILLTGLLLSLSGFAETNVAKAELDTSNIQIGDHIRLTISLQTDEKNTVVFPVLSDTMDNKIVFISVNELDTITDRRAQIKTYSRTFTLTIFEPGEYTFPPFPFLIRIPKDQDFIEVLTNSVSVTVVAPDVDLEADIRDIKNVFSISLFEVLMESAKENKLYIFILLGLILLTFAGIYLYRRWKKKKPLFVFKPKPIIPAHVEALENLEKLRLKQLWQNNLVKEYYTELTDILRIYTEKGLHINAVEMTSDELIEAIADSEFENKSELLSLLRNTLPTSDLVKFAKAMPLADEHDRSFKNVKEFVELTMPKESEVAKENNVIPVGAKHVSPNQKIGEKEEEKS
jgi:LPXTG-motif cell wall-anchored protein